MGILKIGNSTHQNQWQVISCNAYHDLTSIILVLWPYPYYTTSIAETCLSPTHKSQMEYICSALKLRPIKT